MGENNKTNKRIRYPPEQIYENNPIFYSYKFFCESRKDLSHLSLFVRLGKIKPLKIEIMGRKNILEK